MLQQHTRQIMRTHGQHFICRAYVCAWTHFSHTTAVAIMIIHVRYTFHVFEEGPSDTLLDDLQDAENLPPQPLPQDDIAPYTHPCIHDLSVVCMHEHIATMSMSPRRSSSLASTSGPSRLGAAGSLKSGGRADWWMGVLVAG